MRRTWATGAAIVMAVALGGAPAAAQSDTVIVTSTQECDLDPMPAACTYTASDPRVAGTGGHEFVGGIPGPGSFVWSDAWIEGPEGAWTGHHYIFFDDAGSAQVLIMLAGQGAYEGLSYAAFGSDPEGDANHDLVGVIYEGPLPPVGPVPIPAGE